VTRSGSTGLPAIASIDPAIEAGFSVKAADYDRRLTDHPVDSWARAIVRAAVMRRLPPGGSILEINAGTGIDAAALAAAGYRVHATDVAPGMLERAAARALGGGTSGGPGFSVERRSYFDLEGVPGAPFDLVLSNFGGLNCTDRLADVARQVERVLRPGGTAVLVFMPPVCPWEHVQLVRGHLRTALRRWRPGGVIANIGGHGVRTWYPSARTVERAFGPGFRRLAQQSLCLFAPSLMLEGFPRRHRMLTGLGMRLDERLGPRWPFREAGDFVILTLERAVR
jgi:ubiquinone/menaquinone biosynthesis C-methylase UbiE